MKCDDGKDGKIIVENQGAIEFAITDYENQTGLAKKREKNVKID